jgi:hypothetical protein
MANTLLCFSSVIAERAQAFPLKFPYWTLAKTHLEPEMRSVQMTIMVPRASAVGTGHGPKRSGFRRTAFLFDMPQNREFSTRTSGSRM